MIQRNKINLWFSRSQLRQKRFIAHRCHCQVVTNSLSSNEDEFRPRVKLRRCRSTSKAETIVTEAEKMRRAQPDKPWVLLALTVWPDWAIFVRSWRQIFVLEKPKYWTTFVFLKTVSFKLKTAWLLYVPLLEKNWTTFYSNIWSYWLFLKKHHVRWRAFKGNMPPKTPKFSRDRQTYLS